MTDPGVHDADLGVHDADPGVHDADPGVHDADLAVHDGPIQAFTMDRFSQRGHVDRTSLLPELLCAALEPWPTQKPVGRSPEWTALWAAYAKHAPKTRELVADLLACSKGGSMGTIIDPTPVLDALNHVLQHGTPLGLPEEAVMWETFSGVREFVNEVNLHIVHAVQAEGAACVSWLDAMRSLVDLASPKRTFEVVRKALNVAFDHDMVDHDGRPDVRSRLEAAEPGALKASAQHAENGLPDKTFFLQLLSLGKIDREQMTRSQSLVADAEVVVRASTRKTERKLDGLVQGDSMLGLETDIRTLLNRLTAALHTLAEVSEVEPLQ